MSEKKAPPQRFKPGVSGNPKGKAPGTRNHATRAVLELLEDGVLAVTKTVLDAARNGDLTAAKMVLERIVPAMRERPINIALPDTRTAEGCVEAQGSILQAVGMGELLPGEGATLAGIVENRRRSIETVELEARIQALEESSNG